MKKAIRRERMEREIQRVVADHLRHLSLMKDNHSPLLKLTTITETQLSPDLSFARIYFSYLGEQQDKEKLTTYLDTLIPLLRFQVSQKTALRYTPSLRFYYDDSVAKGSYLDQLIQKANSQ